MNFPVIPVSIWATEKGEVAGIQSGRVWRKIRAWRSAVDGGISSTSGQFIWYWIPAFTGMTIKSKGTHVSAC